jgi:hypothetical protein
MKLSFFGMYWREEEVLTEFLVEKPEIKDHFENPAVASVSDKT